MRRGASQWPGKYLGGVSPPNITIISYCFVIVEVSNVTLAILPVQDKFVSGPVQAKTSLQGLLAGGAGVLSQFAGVSVIV
jgi:hypothetical protein